MAKRPLFNEDGLYERTFTRIFELVLLSIYTLIASIPLITIGAAFSSLLYCNRKILKERSIKVTSVFWSNYVLNMKKGIPLWLISLDITAVFGGFAILIMFGKNFFGASFEFPVIGLVIFGIIIIFILMGLSQVFPLNAYFNNTISGTIKTAFQIPFADPLNAFLVALFQVGPFVFCILYPLTTFFQLIIGIAFFGQCIARSYIKIMKKLGYEEESSDEKVIDDMEYDVNAESHEETWAALRMSLEATKNDEEFCVREKTDKDITNETSDNMNDK